MVGMVAPSALALGVLLFASPVGRTLQEKGREPGPARNQETPLPPVERVAGLTGFHSRSTVVFVLQPERPHRLDATYVFPERVRLWLGVESESATSRELHYRYGARAFEVPDQSSVSREFEGAERDRLLRYTDLRRAWMMWPDGFQWKSEGLDRTTDLGSRGRLRARFPAAGEARPIEIASFDTEGTLQDELKALAWRENAGRTWPAAAELWHEGTLAWSEKIDSIDTQGVFVDAYFLPADRRASAAGPKPAPDAIQIRDLPEFCAMRVELAAGSTWKTARAEETRLRRECGERLRQHGFELEGRATIEVSPEGQPRACFVRLATLPAEPPKGFVTIPARKGVAQLVGSFEDVTAARLASVRAAVPAGRRAETAYVRFPIEEDPPTQVLIVVPLATKD